MDNDMTSLVFVGLLMVISCYPQAVDASCPKGFTPNGNKCYYVSQDEANWIGALRYCESIDTHLVNIETQQQQTFLADLINTANVVSLKNISTPNLYQYHYLLDDGIDIRGHSAVKFKVMACNDAHVALSRFSHDSNRDTYEIVLGGWIDSKSTIRDCKQCTNQIEAYHASHPLDCKSYKPFWISWADGNIRVGSGDYIGLQTFMSWNDSDPHDANFLGIATGWGAHGQWLFEAGTYNPGVFWIAAADLLNEGEWQWLRGRQQVISSNWASGEPSNSLNREHCAALDLARGLKWNDDNCEEKRNFICEATVGNE